MSKNLSKKINREIQSLKYVGEDREGKARLRETINAQIDVFKASGGKIEVLPTQFRDYGVEFNHSIRRVSA